MGGLSQPALQRTQGEGRIALQAHDGQTRLERLYQAGAFKARALQPPGQAHMDIALINTAGGLTGGDTMHLHVEAGPGTSTTLSTQACEKFYKAGASGKTVIETSLRVDDGARLNWVPQESIAFDGCDVARTIRVHMAPTAQLLMTESILFGRHASGERFLSGRFADSWSVYMGEQLVHAERFAMAGSPEHPAKLAGHTAMATVLFVAKDAERLARAAREALETPLSTGQARGGASTWVIGGAAKLLVRLVAADGYALRKALLPVIAALSEGHSLARLWKT
ncbi:MAG: urease accessory protein UreD [Pseudomonadota bacterium]